ncbi:MAG TPA: RAMP superfamily CRISPR-associated protein [Ktedonobacteraceae bacterium]|nr:RAMP superfamily CRISPR-associated protein [Ktedonobacteraceae bacterium]
MKYLALSLEALSPLAIRADHAPEGAAATPYISGTTLAGSLAAIHRLYFSDRTPEFEKLFLSGQVQYPDLYPASFKNKALHDDTQLPVYPLPKTAQSCKRFSGFLPFDEDDEDDDHGVRDTLIDWALFRLADDAGQTDPSVLLAPFQAYKVCPQCLKTGNARPMDAFSGYYRRDDDGRMIAAKTRTRLQTHTGINRATGTVQEGILYNRSVFDEHTRFWGMVKIADDRLTRTFEQFVETIGHSGLIRVGTGRTRGMGKVSLSLFPLKDEDEQFRSFQKHLTDFNDTFYAAVKELGSSFSSLPILQQKPFYFALTLHSPAILRDAALRYRCLINEGVLTELLHLPKDYTNHFTLVYQSASSKRITGWNDLWGTPRTNEIAIDAGSVFLFGSTLSKKDLEEALFGLEREGIGQRRAEGFGRVCVSDPFHCEVKLK